MTNLTTFNYLSNEVRVIEKDHRPLFAAVDVCSVLELGHVATATQRLADDEVHLVLRSSVVSNNVSIPNRGLNFITESGLYKLVMRSDKPEARKFQDWVTREVLPAIRKDGGYIAGEERVKTGELDEEEFVLRAMEILQRKVRVRLDAQIRAASAALHIA